MNSDLTAAAYGRFQVAFGIVATTLAGALFRLQERRLPRLTFRNVLRLKFKQMLDQFKDELKQFDPRIPLADHLAEALPKLRGACADMGELARWRNERTHAYVLLVNDGLALYDSRTGKRLTISYDECESNTKRAIKVKLTLETHIRHLVEDLKMDELIGQLPCTSDPVA